MPSPRGMYTMSRDGKRHEGSEARALGAHRVFDHLHEDVVALFDEAADVLDGRRAGSVLSGLGCAMSAACRNAVRSSPTSMNAACMPGNTRCTRPL